MNHPIELPERFGTASDAVSFIGERTGLDDEGIFEIIPWLRGYPGTLNVESFNYKSSVVLTINHPENKRFALHIVTQDGGAQLLNPEEYDQWESKRCESERCDNFPEYRY